MIENKGPYACFLVCANDDTDVGYWRDESLALAKAREQPGGGYVLELDPPDYIACEDDPEPDGPVPEPTVH